METIHKSDNLVEISADADHILHRKGADEYAKIRKAIVRTDAVDEWEEIALADIPPYTQTEYKNKVVELIRGKYDSDDETAVLRQRDTKPEEFAAYNEFAEECKRKAKDLLIQAATAKPTAEFDA